MLVYLFRHGIAEPKRDDQPDDERVLTDEGKKKTRRIAEAMARFVDPPQALLTSPKVRARQTAELVGEAMDLSPQVLAVLGEQSAEPIAKALEHREESSVMMVGHEPTLSELATLLCLGRIEPGAVQLKKAGCCAIDRQGATGQLLFLTTPKLLLAQ